MTRLLETKSLLLLVNVIFWVGLASCHHQNPPVKSNAKSIVHPAPDQVKIDSLKSIRGKGKK